MIKKYLLTTILLLDCQNNVYNMTRKQIDNEKQIKNMHEKIDTIIGLIEDDKKEIK